MDSDKEPRSLAVAEKGIRTSNDLANLMSALMSDIVEGRVTPRASRAICKAAGQLLNLGEIRHKLTRVRAKEEKMNNDTR